MHVVNKYVAIVVALALGYLIENCIDEWRQKSKTKSKVPTVLSAINVIIWLIIAFRLFIEKIVFIYMLLD